MRIKLIRQRHFRLWALPLLVLAGVSFVQSSVDSQEIDWVSVGETTGRSTDASHIVEGSLGVSFSSTSEDCAQQIQGGFWPAVGLAETDDLFVSGFEGGCP